MKRAREIAITVILLSLAVMVPLVGLQISCLITQVSAHVYSLAGSADVIAQATGQTLGTATAAITVASDDVHTIAVQADKMLTQNSKYAKATAHAAAIGTIETARTMQNINRAIQNTDESLNGRNGMFAAIDSFLITTTREVRETSSVAQRQTNDLAYEAKRTNAQLNDLLANLNALQPDVKRAVKSIADTSENTAEVTKTADIATRPLREKGNRVWATIKLIGSGAFRLFTR